LATIHFFTEEIYFTLKQKKLVRQWIIDSCANEGKKPGQINYIFCSDAFLLQLNKSYLNHSSLTDIITFPILDDPSPIKAKAILRALNGEIYISIDRVRENAKKFKIDFENELRRVMIHGVLHLCGYGDKKAIEKNKMRQLESFYLKRFDQKA
jgi:probable rRNA maturation factor